MDDSNVTTVQAPDSSFPMSKEVKNNFSSSVVLFFIFILIYFVLVKMIDSYFNSPEGIIALLIIPGVISLGLTILIKLFMKKLNNKFGKSENNIKPKNKIILSISLWSVLAILLLLSLSVFRGNFMAILDYLFNIPLRILSFFS